MRAKQRRVGCFSQPFIALEEKDWTACRSPVWLKNTKLNGSLQRWQTVRWSRCVRHGWTAASRVESAIERRVVDVSKHHTPRESRVSDVLKCSISRAKTNVVLLFGFSWPSTEGVRLLDYLEEPLIVVTSSHHPPPSAEFRVVVLYLMSCSLEFKGTALCKWGGWLLLYCSTRNSHRCPRQDEAKARTKINVRVVAIATKPCPPHRKYTA